MISKVLEIRNKNYTVRNSKPFNILNHRYENKPGL